MKLTATHKQFLMTVAAGVTTALVINFMYRHIMPPVGKDDTCNTSSSANSLGWLQ